MRKAIALSRRNIDCNGGGPFGAVIVRNGRVIGEGTNRVTTANDPTAHAEIEAIRAACRKLGTYDLSGATIYSSCEPCPMCLAAIYWARMDAVYFANTQRDAAAIEFDDAFLYKELKRPLSARKLPMKRLLRTEALAVFRRWQNKADKIPY